VSIAPTTEIVIPTGLVEAAERGTLVPFIGAGVSRLAGCPSWLQFADRVIDVLVSDRVLSPAQRSQLAGLTPRLKLSVAQLASAEAKYSINYREILQPDGWSEHALGQRVYGHISSLGQRFVTTNYDEWLDIVIRPPATNLGEAHQSKSSVETRRPLHLPEHMTPDQFSDAACVAHLHGSLKAPEGMVLSTSDYIRRYASDRHRIGGEGENLLLSFLEYVFTAKTVLFVGYGLEELEILEYVIMKARSSGNSKANPHYILQGYFSFETEICSALQNYYRKDCGIELIPFRRDENDWEELVRVLEKFSTELSPATGLVVQELLEMRGFAE
jgi:hypothetical protein